MSVAEQRHERKSRLTTTIWAQRNVHILMPMWIWYAEVAARPNELSGWQSSALHQTHTLS